MDDPREDAIFAEALAASEPSRAVPPGFAERVVAQLAKADGGARARARARAWRRAVVAASAISAAAAAGVLAWRARSVEGAVDLAASDGGPSTTVLLGRRGRAVVEPGTRLRYRVGGLAPGAVDTVEIERGAVFFRIDTGGAFEVHTPFGTTQVTGTCFRVAVTDERDDGAQQQNGGGGMGSGDERARQQRGLGMVRARWFGAGALAAAATMAVTVYEGGVNVASARARGQQVHLAPGEAALIARGGALARVRAADADPTAAATATAAREGAAGASGSAPGAGAAASAAGATGDDAAARAELERLRGLLARNGISPETGARTADAGAPHGIDDPSDTDLTPDEWRVLAERGELRFRLPAVARSGDTVDDRRAQRLGIPEQDRTEVNDALRRAQARLTSDLRALYREAAGTEAGTMSDQAMMNEIGDKTPEDVVAATNWQLAQERGGLAPAQPIRPDMPPYERMMRELIGYEAQLEREIAAIIGEPNAHALLHGDHAIGAHGYGMSARRPSH